MQRGRDGVAQSATEAAIAVEARLPQRHAIESLPVAKSARGAILAWGTRRHRGSPIRLMSFVLCVALPGALAGAYYGLIAADQYVAEFRFGLRTGEPVRSEALSVLEGAVSPGGTRFDSYAVVQYLASRAIVDDLDRRLDLRQMFSRPQADWPARLHLPAPIEELVAFWQRQVDAFYDPGNGSVTVRVRAFSPSDALTLAQGIAVASERLVNEISARARRDSLRDAEAEVARDEARLQSALAQLRDFRDRVGMIDPEKAANASAALAGRLRDEIVRANTELATLRSYMHVDAPSVRLLAARVRALEAQRRAVEGEITTGGKARPAALTQVMGSYEQLESDRSFAAGAYQHALQALDRSRAEADRQQVYLAGFIPPTLPEEALYPHRLRSVGIVLMIGFAVWAIGGLIVQSVRDHL